MMTQILKSGHQVGVVNDFMTYFDISKVYVNADRIAYGLMKAAGVAGEVVPAAFLADDYVLFPPDTGAGGLMIDGAAATKLAELKKLSDIEKEIEMMGCPEDNSQLALPDDLPEDVMSQLQELLPGDKANLFGALSDVQISLSLNDFMRLVMGKKNTPAIEDQADAAQDRLPGMFSRMLDGPTNRFLNENVEMDDGLLPKRIRDLISGLIPTHSLAAEPARKRVTVMIIRGGKPNAGALVKPAGLQTAGGETNEVADRLAEAYGQYKFAFLQRNGGTQNRTLTGLTLLQHYWS